MASYIVTDRIRVNIVHSFAIPPRVKCEQYDGDYTKLIQAIVYNGDVLYNIPSAVRRIVVSGLKPDGNGFSYDCTWSGNTVSFSLMRQMTAVNGDVPCNITMFDSENNQVSSAVFVLAVEKAALPSDVVVSSNDFQTFVDYVQAANLYWQYSKSYAVGNTGVRGDENVDNAKYYAHLAKTYKGSPLTASTISEMIDTERVYVYVGNESGYNNGHWYFYDDTAWVDGGVYNAQGQQTDTELITPGIAADAKAVGDILFPIASSIVTPKQFGAIGDGVTDDTNAFKSALLYAKSLQSDFNVNNAYKSFYNNIAVFVPNGKYLITDSLTIPANISFIGAGINATILWFDASMDIAIKLEGEEKSISGTSGQIITSNIEISNFTLNGNYKADRGISNYNNNVWVEKMNMHDLYIAQCNYSCLDIRSCWGANFNNIRCECSAIPVIFAKSASGSGFNGNTVSNVWASNFSFIGMFLEAQECDLLNINIERGYDYKYTNLDIQSLTINNKSYNEKAGLFITGTSDNISVTGAWFEWLYRVTDCPCVLVKDVDTYSSNRFKGVTANIKNVHLGTQNICIYRILSGIVILDGLRADLTLENYKVIDTNGADANTSLLIEHFTHGHTLSDVNDITLPYGAYMYKDVVFTNGSYYDYHPNYNNYIRFENDIYSFERYVGTEYKRYIGGTVISSIMENECVANRNKVKYLTGGNEDVDGYFDLGFKNITSPYHNVNFIPIARNALAQGVLSGDYWVQAKTLSNGNVGIRFVDNTTPISIPSGALFSVTIDYAT